MTISCTLLWYVLDLQVQSYPAKARIADTALQQEAYWYSVLHPPGGFSNPQRECLKGCTDVIKGVCSWCWTR